MMLNHNAMRDNIAKTDSTGRRDVLKRIGAGLATIASVPAVSGAKSGRENRFDEIFHRAKELRNRTGRQDLFVRYLENHGYRVATNSRTFNVEHNDVSTQKLGKQAISTDMTLAYEYQCKDGYAYVDYYIDVDPTWGKGEPGPDDITITWNDDHYRILDYKWYSDGKNVSYKDSTLNGINWEFGDGSACWGGCDTSISVGSKIELLKTEQERAVRGKYHHTWSDVEFKGFGVSSAGGVVWNYTPTEHKWEGKYETREDADATETIYCV